MVVVLVVEDEALVRLVAAEELLDAGFRVIEAHDADEALALLGARPDCAALVTDVRMPGAMDGIALAQRVARERPHMRIVVVSGHATPSAAALPPGATFLAKPYLGTQLRQALAGLLEGAGTADAVAAIDVAEAVIAPGESTGLGAAADRVDAAAEGE